MKFWIINNTKFGYKNNSKEWSKNMFDYFDNHFLPFIQKHAKPGDKLIHLGNIFNSSETVNIELLLTVRDLFVKISEILPVILLDGNNEKNYITKLFRNEKDGVSLIENMWYSSKIENCHTIPIHDKPLNIIDKQPIIFLNSRIDIDILKKFPDTLFFCGFHDERLEEDNVIQVGSPYQLDKTSIEKGFYVLDTDSKKYKFVKNNYSPKYNTITITDISQIDEIDASYVDKNHVNVVIDKTLIDDKKIKIDVLLSKYNFKSISYTNDDEKVELVDSSSMDMEDLIREKIKGSDNKDLLPEFENIMNIYKERY